jgi:hypothetical protein
MPGRKKIIRTLKIFLGLLATNCSTSPQMDPHLWSADGYNGQIFRQGTIIRCDDPKFEDFVCMPKSDLGDFYNKMSSCKEWGN